MEEISRPTAQPTPAERMRAALEFFGLGRMLAVGCSVVAVLLGGWWLLHAPPTPIEQDLPLARSAASSTVSAGAAAGASPAAPTPPEPTTAEPTTSGVIVVQAAGAVVHPGVYTLASGSRVQDLIQAAGGAVPGAAPDALPLATVLVDGQRVEVPMEGEVVVPLAGTSGGAGGAAPVGPLDLNRATAEQLDGLPGVGPATAGAIVAHRTQNGPFRSVDDLLDVRGIGPSKLDAIRSEVTV